MSRRRAASRRGPRDHDLVQGPGYVAGAELMYTIERDGMHLREPFRGTSGILSGNITHGRAEDEEQDVGEGPEPLPDD